MSAAIQLANRIIRSLFKHLVTNSAPIQDTPCRHINKLVRVLEKGVGVEEEPVRVGDAEANDLVGLGC